MKGNISKIMRRSVQLVNQVGVSGAGAKVGGGVGASVRLAPCIIRVIPVYVGSETVLFRSAPCTKLFLIDLRMGYLCIICYL